MTINNDIIRRLNEIIQENEPSMRRFALNLGHSPSTLSEILTNRIKTLSNSFVALLEIKYGINPIWLETGEGKKEANLITLSRPDELHLVRQYRCLNPTNKEIICDFVDALYYKQDLQTGQWKVAEKRPGYKPGKKLSK